MFKVILAYILALLSMSLLAGFLHWFMIPLFHIRVRAAEPIITFVFGAVPMFIALIIFFWVCGKIEVQPTYSMFLLPFILVMMNCFQRIDAAKKGRTISALMLRGDYDAKFAVKIEYGYLVGNLFGIGLFFLLLNRLPLY